MIFDKVLLFGLAATATATPTLVRRDYSANDLDNDTTCRAVYHIVARGSGEWDNLGQIGSIICTNLKNRYGTRAGCQGLSSPGYPANYQDNWFPEGTAPISIQTGIKYFNLAQSKCTKAVVVASGYSQGAALLHAAIPQLPAATKNQIVGVTLFGDTKYNQTAGTIANFPRDRYIIYCNPDDGVCNGQLNPNAGHVAYVTNGDVGRATTFLIGKIEAALRG